MAVVLSIASAVYQSGSNQKIIDIIVNMGRARMQQQISIPLTAPVSILVHAGDFPNRPHDFCPARFW
jgi:hypothetical protein